MQVAGETVVITHPCHPNCGHELAVVRHHRDPVNPSVVVELPDLTRRRIPLTWTDRADPNVEILEFPPRGRLLGSALLELAALIHKWQEEA